MSEDLEPSRRELRASHEDRDEVVEQLRVAAGDGRLTADELDERLEAALTARTQGELERLLLDLPSVPRTASMPAPVAEEVVRVQSSSANVERVGPWVVPRRMEVQAHSSNVRLDLSEALITQPILELDVDLHHANLRLVVVPGVKVDMSAVNLHSSNAKHRVRPEPDVPTTLLIRVSGSLHNSNLTVRAPRGPRRTFWQWLFRRPVRNGPSGTVARLEP